MKCEHPDLSFCIATNSIGIISVILLLIFTFAKNMLDRCVRQVMITFLLANIVGTFIILQFSLICSEKIWIEIPLVRVSLLVSLFHLFLLLWAEYSALLSQGKYRSNDKYHKPFGFVTFVWVISITLGTLMTTKETQPFFAYFIFVAIVFLLLFLFAFIQMSRWRKKVQSKYYLTIVQPNKALGQSGKDLSVQKKMRMVLVGIHVLFFICFAASWCICEIMNARSAKETSPIVLLIYTSNFYVPVISCLYLACYKRFHS